jgi:serine palmitoyltransferase
MEGDMPPLSAIYQLKLKYGFILYCDEAHSFLSIGETGRGCLEFWNQVQPNSLVPLDLFDIRTATLSKAVGGIGGLICGKAQFEEPIRRYIQKMEQQGCESLSSSTMVQTLWVLGQPTLVARHLCRLNDMSRFCRAELARFGVYIYGDAGTPVLPVFAGSPNIAGKLSYELRRFGLLATPVTTPAVPYWESRVRINLSAEHTDDEANMLVDAIINATQASGLCERREIPRHRYYYHLIEGETATEADEAAETYRSIRGLIEQAAEGGFATTSNPDYVFDSKCDASVIQAGHASRAKYGVGSGGARWICGTFPPHLTVESLVAEATGMESGMTYSDTSVGLASTIAAICRQVIGFKEHTLLIKGSPDCMPDGIIIAPKKGAPNIVWYDNISETFQFLSQISHGINKKRKYVTFCLNVFDECEAASLPSLVSRLQRDTPSIVGMTLLINSPSNLLGSLKVLAQRRSNFQVLIFGSFYRTFGIPGGYLTGSATLIQELRYWSRGYMFTTSPPPFMMDMIRRALEIQISTSDGIEKGR